MMRKENTNTLFVCVYCMCFIALMFGVWCLGVSYRSCWPCRILEENKTLVGCIAMPNSCHTVRASLFPHYISNNVINSILP